MTQPFDGLDELAEAFDEETCERLDREIAASPQPAPALSEAELIPDPDPYGANWEWAQPAPSPAPATQAPPAAEPSRPRRSLLRDLAYAGGFAVAASLLVALGYLVAGRGGGREVAMAARVGVAEDVPRRGPGTVASVAIDNTADRQAFVTVVGLAPAAKPPALHYLENGSDIAVESKGSVTLTNLPPEFTGTKTALVVLTPTPAGDVVRRIIAGEPRSAADADAVKTLLLRELSRMG